MGSSRHGFHGGGRVHDSHSSNRYGDPEPMRGGNYGGGGGQHSAGMQAGFQAPRGNYRDAGKMMSPQMGYGGRRY